VCERCVKALTESKNRTVWEDKGRIRVSGARWFVLSLAVLARTRASKLPSNAIRPVLPPFHRFGIVVLVHSQNPGIAFGVFSNSSSPWLAPLLL